MISHVNIKKFCFFHLLCQKCLLFQELDWGHYNSSGGNILPVWQHSIHDRQIPVKQGLISFMFSDNFLIFDNHFFCIYKASYCKNLFWKLCTIKILWKHSIMPGTNFFVDFVSNHTTNSNVNKNIQGTISNNIQKFLKSTKSVQDLINY